jgi:hypothetical protein
VAAVHGVPRMAVSSWFLRVGWARGDGEVRCRPPEVLSEVLSGRRSASSVSPPTPGSPPGPGEMLQGFPDLLVFKGRQRPLEVAGDPCHTRAMAPPRRRGHERQPSPRASGFWSFWTTLPGVLTGLAGVVDRDRCHCRPVAWSWLGCRYAVRTRKGPSAFSISVTCRGAG